jgi:hypothetical protein
MTSLYVPIVVALVAIAFFAAIPLIEHGFDVCKKRKLVRSGRTIAWPEALKHVRQGDGLIVDNHTGMEYGRLWWVPVPKVVDQYCLIDRDVIMGNKEPDVTSCDPLESDCWLYDSFGSTGFLITSVSVEQAKETLIREGLITRWRTLDEVRLNEEVRKGHITRGQNGDAAIVAN